MVALYFNILPEREKVSVSVQRFAAICLGLSLLLEITCAVFSEGFHHYDEHFQILEFANHKLANTPASDLPWEYRDSMRPWLQPFVFYGLASAWKAVGVTDPFVWILSARILSSLLGWLCSLSLVLCCFRWFRSESLQKWAIFSTCFVWFLPYSHARFSSEGWATSLFFIGFCFLIREVQVQMAEGPSVHPRPRSLKFLLAGFLLGLAFHCRYQVGIMILFAVLWCLTFARFRLRTYATLLASFLVAVALGFAMDRWGYGTWVLTPWNFFRVNLIEGKAAAQWGSYPWWFYFYKVFTSSGPILNLLILFFVPAAWILKPRFSLTWCTLPFVLVHMLIPHKELRYLFPVIPVVPILVFMAIQALKDRRIFAWWGQIPSGARKAIVVVLITINMLMLFARSFVAPRQEIGFYRYLYHQKMPVILYAKDPQPYQMAGVITHVYRPEGLAVRQILNYSELSSVLNRSKSPLWLFHSGPTFPEEAQALKPYCKLDYTTTPAWLNRYRAVLGRVRVLEWSLFRCEKPNTNAAPTRKSIR